MKAIATTLSRFVGLTAFAYAAFVFFVNLVSAWGGSTYNPVWSLYLVLGLGMTGMVGAVLFLMSFDGPSHHRTRSRRFLGWTGMMICASLPSSILIAIAPMVLLSVLSILLPPELPARRRGRHLATSG